MFVNNININVKEIGDGEHAFVFLHYWGGSSRTWNWIIDILNEKNNKYKFITFDHRGWGESDSSNKNYNISDLANDAQIIIESYKLKNYILVGHSMGGKIAQLLASRRLQGLKGLILIAPAPPTPMKIPDEQRKNMIHFYDTKESINFAIDNALTYKIIDNIKCEQIINDSLCGSIQAKESWPLIIMCENILENIKNIDVPTHIIAGEMDKVESINTIKKEIMPYISNISIDIIQNTGHLLPLESPEEVTKIIKKFIENIKF
ncbi:alpha/beta hydrolase fold family protein [Lichtheimia hyalospora FSU 10163]|nr:alpha/beta hydrolase fold family protein [Lichtheimia hyalospora FSU 10163]